MEDSKRRSSENKSIMNILKIDTSNNLSTKVEIEFNGKKYAFDEKREKPGDQNVLELLEKLLSTHEMKLEDIDMVEVNTGPGSFTGLRVGVSIANALSFSCHVKVNGKPIGEIITPEY